MGLSDLSILVIVCAILLVTISGVIYILRKLNPRGVGERLPPGLEKAMILMAIALAISCGLSSAITLATS